MDGEERDLRQGNAHILLSKDWNDWFDHRVAMLRAKYEEAREDYQEVINDRGESYSDEERQRALELLDNVANNEAYLNQAVTIIERMREINNADRQRADEANNMMRDLERLGATDRLGGGEIVEIPAAPQFDFHSNGREHSDSSEHSRYIDEIGLSRNNSRRNSGRTTARHDVVYHAAPNESRGPLTVARYEHHYEHEMKSGPSQEAMEAESQGTDDDAADDELLEDVSPLDSPFDEDEDPRTP